MLSVGVVLFSEPSRSTGDARSDGPTALEPVANRPIAAHVLDSLAAAGIDEVVAITPVPLRRRVQQLMVGDGDRFPRGIHYAAASGRVDIHTALRLAAPIVQERPCVVHDASGLLEEPLTRIKEMQRGSLDLSLLLYQGAEANDRLGPDLRKLLRVAEIDERESAFGLAGVCAFGEGGLSAASATDRGPDGEIDVAGIVSCLTAAGGNLDVRVAGGWHQYGGDALELLELNRIALDGLDPVLTQSHQNGSRIEGRVVIDPTASVRASVIVGPATIGARAEVVDAYVGPYTSIGNGARIEGAEIERSIIADGASVVHVGRRMVSSVIGRNARVFRDFALPRALRLRVGEGNEVSWC